MKKSQFVTGFFSLMFVTMFNIVTYSKTVVPAEIQKIVLTTYPQAENITWKEYSDTQYLAYFIVGDEEVDVYINSETAAIVECVTHLNEHDIPQAIKDHLAAMEAGAKLYYVLETDFPDHSRFYIAKVKIDGEMYEMSFDSKFEYLAQHKTK